MPTQRATDHEDHADEAQAAERGGAWPQAAALYRRAAEACPDAVQAATYAQAAEKCDAEVTVDAALAAIAKRVLRIPTLDERKADSLDFHDVSVWGLRDALREAYRAGR